MMEESMQAIIMAAGRGSRLGNLTDEIPKAFLEVRGHRLIDYSIALLHWQGVSDIKIVTGYKSEKYEELAGKTSGVTCIYNPFYDKCNVLGSFYMAQGYLKDEDTIYMHADTLCDVGLFAEMTKAQGDIVLPVDFRPCDEEAMKIETKNGQVIRLDKSIPLDVGEGEFIGIAKLGAKAMPAIKRASKKLVQDGKLSSYFEAAIQEVINSGGYSTPALPTSGRFWGEVDFEADYEFVKKNLPDDLWNLAENDRHE